MVLAPRLRSASSHRSLSGSPLGLGTSPLDRSPDALAIEAPGRRRARHARHPAAERRRPRGKASRVRRSQRLATDKTFRASEADLRRPCNQRPFAGSDDSRSPLRVTLSSSRRTFRVGLSCLEVRAVDPAGAPTRGKRVRLASAYIGAPIEVRSAVLCLDRCATRGRNMRDVRVRIMATFSPII
jgi:hypothetical protein